MTQYRKNAALRLAGETAGETISHSTRLSNNNSQVHPRGVPRKGRQIRCQSKTGRSLHRRDCKGLTPQQHTQAGYQNLGFSMIEVLVTIAILMIGLLGLAGLQARALTSQMESYQRSQALILLKDMSDRIDANRKNAGAYVTTGLTPPNLGVGSSQGTNCAGLTGKPLDFCEWNNALLGAAEQTGGLNVGAMIGARGCVLQIVAPASGVPAIYQVVVSWQGLNSTFAPDVTTPTSATSTSAGWCASGQYKDRAGAVKEGLHRAVSLPVSVANLN